MLSNMNRYSCLHYESDDEEYEKRLLQEQEKKRSIKEGERKLKEEKRKNRDNAKMKQYETDYAKNIKRTKIYDKITLGFDTFVYVGEIKEDDYNIARYLNLNSFLQQTVDVGKLHGLFCNDEYLRMVKHMELFKNKNYFPLECLEYINDIQQNQISGCVVNNLGIGNRMVYEIYIVLLLDTPCVRKAFDYYPHGKYLMGVFKENLKNKIKNQYGNVNELEQEYYNKYFELGKRYFAKRNNFKVLFRNYVRFIGKLMIIWKK